MKKLVYLLTFITSSAKISAQTLTLANYSMVPAESFNIAKGNYQSAGSAGINQQWTIAALTNSTSENYAVLASNQLTQQLFPGSDVSVNNNANMREFFDFTATEALYLGSLQGVGPATTAINYNDPKKTMAFPFSYNDSFTDNWATQNGFSGTTTVTADGTGSLTTPYGTFTNTLRVNINRFNISTTYTVATSIFNFYTPHVHSYLASVMTSTVANTSGTNVISTLYVLKAGPTNTTEPVDPQDPVDPLGIHSIENMNTDIAVFPRPPSDQVIIRASYPLNDATLKIYDIQSTQVMELKDISGKELKVERKNLVEGIYFFTIEDRGNTLRGKIIFD